VTKATETKAASNARVSATLTAAAAPVASANNSSAAMPPVPSSWAAMMRSASLGPRRTRIKPSATIASTKPAAANKKSAISRPPPDHLGNPSFLRGELRRYRLLDIQAVDQKSIPTVAAGRDGAWQ